MLSDYFSEINDHGTVVPVKDLAAFPRSEQAVLGAKNLLPVPYLDNTKTSAGITFTNNSDGTITISGTNSGESSYHNLYVTENPNTSKLPLGKDLIYSLGIANNLGIQARIEVNNVAIAPEAEATKRFTMPTSYTKVLITIRVPANTVISSPITVKPMIRLASDPDDTYVPYAMTNKELTDAVVLKDVTSDITLNTEQTAYSVSTLCVYKIGRLITAIGDITSLTENAVPTGRGFTTIATGLPKALKSSNMFTMPIGSGNQTQIFVEGSTGNFKMRGGTNNQTYQFVFTYISES